MMSSRISDGNKGVFYVDGDEMYVPNTLISLLDKGDSKESKTGDPKHTNSLNHNPTNLNLPFICCPLLLSLC